MKAVLRCVREYFARREQRRLRTQIVLRAVKNYMREQRRWEKSVVEGVMVVAEPEVAEVEEPAQPDRELSTEQLNMWNAVNSAIHRRAISVDDGTAVFHHIGEIPGAGWPSKEWAAFFRAAGPSDGGEAMEAAVEAFMEELEEEEDEGVDKSLAVENPAGEMRAPAKRGKKAAKTAIPLLIERQLRGATLTRFRDMEARNHYNKMGQRNVDAERPFHPAVVQFAGFQKFVG